MINYNKYTQNVNSMPYRNGEFHFLLHLMITHSILNKPANYLNIIII